MLLLLFLQYERFPNAFPFRLIDPNDSQRFKQEAEQTSAKKIAALKVELAKLKQDSVSSSRAMMESVKEVMDEAEQKFEENTRAAETKIAEAEARARKAEDEVAAVRSELRQMKEELDAVRQANTLSEAIAKAASPRLRRTRSCDASTFLISSPCSPRRSRSRRTPSRGSVVVA